MYLCRNISNLETALPLTMHQTDEQQILKVGYVNDCIVGHK